MFPDRAIRRMSIFLERGKEIGGTRYVRGLPCFPACESPAASRSSSIGRNSDCSSEAGYGGEDGGEAEVQSSYKGPLETMDALEDSLPIRRGISKFYCGKSKSFASLLNDTSKLSSAKELGKPENPYSRKRKNLLAMSSRWETPDSERPIGFVSKRRANSSSRIAGTATTGNCSGEGRDQFRLLPPLHPIVSRNASQWSSPPLPEEIEGLSFPLRSFSLMDLQGMESLSSSSSSSSIGSELHKEFS